MREYTMEIVVEDDDMGGCHQVCKWYIVRVTGTISREMVSDYIEKYYDEEVIAWDLEGVEDGRYHPRFDFRGCDIERFFQRR